MLATLRRAWAQLTSMRTALVLLFLLALAAVPGSALPQRPLNPVKVDEYFAEHPRLAPFLDRLWGFDVFASPWFAAVYLLLFVSLTGCLVSRVKVHIRPLWTGPPASPRNLSRLPLAEEFTADRARGDAVTRVRAGLRSLGWRHVRETTAGDGTVTFSGEKGYLREVGNLVFHFALVAVLVGVAVGSTWGWKGGVLVTEGGQFCNTVQAYDQFEPGRLVTDSDLPPFCVAVDDFRATYIDGGQPTRYEADIRYRAGADAAHADPDRRYELAVNEPLRMDGAGVYLINHGYAPILRYRDRFGTVFESPTPFLPQDGRWTSEGVVALPDANQDPASDAYARDVQMAFEGIYMPDAPESGPPIRSMSPERLDEAVTIVAYRGDTGMDAGIPHSVYSLDERQVEKGALKSLGSKLLRKGESWTLDDGTEVTFVGSREWISVEIAHDPGQVTALAGAGFMVAGLLVSLFVRRRRLFVRVSGDDRATVAVGGLARGDSHAYAGEFSKIVSTLRRGVGADREPAAAGVKE